MTQQRPTPPSPRHRGDLDNRLTVLAGTPDDHSSVEDQLIAIAQLSARHVAAVRYAAVTARHDDTYTTVAASDDIALAVDQAQYADQAGSWLEALETVTPMPVPDVVATMRWPGFRDRAHGLGLCASLSIPLFAGRGLTIADLDLYGRDPAMMAILTGAVRATYGQAAPSNFGFRGLDPGGADLVVGLTHAFGVRVVIQQAIGVLMAEQATSPDRAYAILRLRAAETETSLPAAAGSIVTDHHH
jgi:hypothetical protein